MKDIKLMIIGFLLATCFFLFIGWTGYNQGNIVCSTITLIDKNGNEYAEINQKFIDDIDVENNSLFTFLLDDINANKLNIGKSNLGYSLLQDSTNNAFLKMNLSIDKLSHDINNHFIEREDALEELDDGISSIKTQTKRDKRVLDAEIQKLKESIEEINIRLDEEL